VVGNTPGPVKLGLQGWTITMQHRRTTPRNMATAGRLSGLVIHALRHLGKAHVTPERIAHLKRTLPADQRRALIKDIKFTPAWNAPDPANACGGLSLCNQRRAWLDLAHKNPDAHSVLITLRVMEASRGA
jgi:uncharacterized protein DUF6088